MTKKQKRELRKIIITGVLFVAAVVCSSFIEVPESLWFIELLVWIGIYIYAGGNYIVKAIRNVVRGSLLDENFLMTVATVGAFCIGEYTEAVAVMLFYSIGELFQSVAVGKSRKNIASLVDMRSDFARVVREGVQTEVDPSEVTVGETIIVKPGEKIPLDGVVVEGSANINASYITGESAPAPVAAGDNVISGTVSLDGLLTIRVEKAFEESTVSKILELVENSSIRKAKTEKFITRFANVYTPAVVIAAVLIAIIPSLITGDWGVWVKKALVFLVVSCPCALVISVPMSFFGGIGGASGKGILIKGADHLEKLSKADKFVFDKTGTITSGKFSVRKIQAAEAFSEGELVDIIYTAESVSNHPVSVSLCDYCKANGAKSLNGEFSAEELPGLGVSVKSDTKEIYVGNRRLAVKFTVDNEMIPVAENTAVYAVMNGMFAGYAELVDSVKDNVPTAIKMIKELCNGKTFVLSGDKKSSVAFACEKSGIDEYKAELLPADKVAEFEKIMNTSKGATVYVGDGINDSPVLARSDVGIAMGGVGQDAAIEAADIVIMDDDIGKIPIAVKVAKKTMGIVWQNIIFALGVKLLVLVLTLCGVSSMWLAVFADVGVSALAIINALRALR